MRAGLTLFLMVASALVWAADPPRTDDARIKEEAALRQKLIGQRFREFEEALLRVAQRLERSAKPEDQQKAKALRQAIDLAAKEAIDVRLDRLTALLKGSPVLSLKEIQDAVDLGEKLNQDLRTIINFLVDDQRIDKLRAQRKQLEELVRQLNAVLRDQKVVRTLTEAGKRDASGLAKEQDTVAGRTDGLAKELETNEQFPGKELVRAAHGDQKNSSKQIADGQRDQASDTQTAAIDKLAKVRDALQKLLNQIREQEVQEILANLEARCRRMLQMQIEVRDGTLQVEKDVAGNPNAKPVRANEQKALVLADREGLIVREADKVVAFLKEEGSSVAFTEVFDQLREDAKLVQKRLDRADVGSFTQKVEKDIIDTLEEMLDAVVKSRQQPPGGGGGGGGPGNQGPAPGSRLVDLLAELKMIRAMQVRVNQRTESYGKHYPGEQADAPEIRDELGKLADRQKKIQESTKNAQQEFQRSLPPGFQASVNSESVNQ